MYRQRGGGGQRQGGGAASKTKRTEAIRGLGRASKETQTIVMSSAKKQSITSKNQSKECDAHLGPRRFTMGLRTTPERSPPRGESAPAAARLAPPVRAALVHSLEAARTRLEADEMVAVGPSAPPPERTSQPRFPSHATDSGGARARFARATSAQVGGGCCGGTGATARSRRRSKNCKWSATNHLLLYASSLAALRRARAGWGGAVSARIAPATS